MKKIILYILILFPVVAIGQQNQGLYSKYHSAIRKGNFKKAEKELIKIANTENNVFLSLLTHGHYYGNTGQLDSAKLYLEKAINYNKYSPISYTDVDLKSKKDSLYTVIIDVYDIIIAGEPTSVNFCNRAIYKKDIGLYEESLTDFNQSISLDSIHYLGYYNRALAYDKLNLLDSALNDYNTAIRLNPEYGASYLNKGFIYLTMESYDLAIDAFLEGLEVLQNTKEISFTLNNIGFCYYKQDNYIKADELIKESLKLNSINSYAYKNLALVQIAKGESRAACKSIEKSIELGFVDQYGEEILNLKEVNCKK